MLLSVLTWARYRLSMMLHEGPAPGEGGLCNCITILWGEWELSVLNVDHLFFSFSRFFFSEHVELATDKIVIEKW